MGDVISPTNNAAGFQPKTIPLPRIPTGQRRLFRVPKPGAGAFIAATNEEHGDVEHERKATW